MSPPTLGPGGRIGKAWILESVGEEEKTFLGKIGGDFMAVSRLGGEEEVFVARWERWSERAVCWERRHGVDVYVDMPSLVQERDLFAGEGNWTEGEAGVFVHGREYVVRALQDVEGKED